MRHPNKHIQAALEYAASKGWTIRKSRGHAFCIIMCPAGRRGTCRMSVWSTPVDPQGHARRIIAYVDDCPHRGDEA